MEDILSNLLKLTGDALVIALVFVTAIVMWFYDKIAFVVSAVWNWGILGELFVVAVGLYLMFIILRPICRYSNILTTIAMSFIIVFSVWIMHISWDSSCNNGQVNTGVVYMVCLGADA
ncbi:hypothetical protein DRQ53_08590 [bacterium]|nr:MAG: hypothetical protein DRQ53_08590 [bacterium]